jgi:predicted nucleotidyltransferase
MAAELRALVIVDSPQESRSMHVAESLLQKIVRRMLEVSQADRIILFGSAARGQMTADSDIDLLVLESSPDEPRQESVRLRNALRGLGCPST